ncbi:hypothetical protein MMC10_001103 [Thelotrema lepadinum]|nr:hypothetical protein [Thelotrema lepadinum]
MATHILESSGASADQSLLFPEAILIPLRPPRTHSLSVVSIKAQSPPLNLASKDTIPESAQLSSLRSPTLIAFHGSGDSLTSWLSFARVLQTKLPQVSLLLYSRAAHDQSTGPANQSPTAAIEDLVSLLKVLKLKPPYVLVAHSYGGCIARTFLHLRGAKEVAGMVLVETGQETRLPGQAEEAQMRNGGVMGEKPVVVIRGNSMLGQCRELEKKEALLGERERSGEEWERKWKGEKERLAEMRGMFETLDREDERLKRVQLGLSRRSRFVQVADVGHHVVRDRPEEVVEGVQWVLENLASGQESIKGGLWGRISENLAEGQENIKDRLWGRMSEAWRRGRGESK